VWSYHLHSLNTTSGRGAYLSTGTAFNFIWEWDSGGEDVAQDRNQCRALVNRAMNLRVP